MLGVRLEYAILTVAWRFLVNTFVQASGGISAIAEVLVFKTALRGEMRQGSKDQKLNNGYSV